MARFESSFGQQSLIEVNDKFRSL